VVLKRFISITSLVFLGLIPSAAQRLDHDSLPDYNKRKNILLAGGVTGYALGSAFLYQNWYARYDRSAFHFYNDWGEWNNMDKLGHIQASYFQTDMIYKGLLWAGTNEDKALLQAGFISLGFQSTIEIMDGFSEKWGFSVPDFASNILGASLFVVQHNIWQQQKLKIKYSYFPSGINSVAITEPGSENNVLITERKKSLFGNTLPQQMLKDYNGQTFWLSANPSDWIPASQWPAFLAIAAGYGSNNMLGGYSNKWKVNGTAVDGEALVGPRYRQYILALDYDLSKLRTRSPFLKQLLHMLNHLKWPAPAVELRSDGSLHFHLLFLG